MKNRVTAFDHLRIFTIFAVVFLHVASQNWYITGVKTAEWQIFNALDSMVRWAVPVLVMISGALFLDKEVNMKKLVSQNILRLITAYIFWSLVYAIVAGGDPLTILSNTFYGHYHLWFIPMIIGLYICIPVLQQIVKSEKSMKYFLRISLIFIFILPALMQLFSDFGGEVLRTTANIYNKIFNDMYFHLAAGYPFYFILGHYLNKMELQKRNRLLTYALGILGGILTIVLTVLASMKARNPVENYYGHFEINVLLESIGIFIWFKYNMTKTKGNGTVLKKLSRYSFGVYLVHALIMEQMNSLWGINTLSFHPILSVPVLSIVIFLISYLISALLNQIPFLKKYIV